MNLARSDEIFSSDFSKGSFEALGWTVKGDWEIVDYGSKAANLANNPGLVAKFRPGDTSGMLVKKFDMIQHPPLLTLTFDAGYGYGNKDHSQGIRVMLLDLEGSGYVFAVARADAEWGAQWGKVVKYECKTPMKWAPVMIDTTQESVLSGGGLRTFTITRDGRSKWTFSGNGWKNGPLTFTDKSTSLFTQVALCGGTNTDELVFNKIKLEVQTAQ